MAPRRAESDFGLQIDKSIPIFIDWLLPGKLFSFSQQRWKYFMVGWHLILFL